MSKRRVGNRFTRNEGAVKAIREYFTLGFSAGDTYREVNKSELRSKEPPLIGRTTVYKLYKEWLADGKPGALRFIENRKLPDGAIMAVYQDAAGNIWTGRAR